MIPLQILSKLATELGDQAAASGGAGAGSLAAAAAAAGVNGHLIGEVASADDDSLLGVVVNAALAVAAANAVGAAWAASIEMRHDLHDEGPHDVSRAAAARDSAAAAAAAGWLREEVAGAGAGAGASAGVGASAAAAAVDSAEVGERGPRQREQDDGDGEKAYEGALADEGAEGVLADRLLRSALI